MLSVHEGNLSLIFILFILFEIRSKTDPHHHLEAEQHGHQRVSSVLWVFSATRTLRFHFEQSLSVVCVSVV